MAASIRKRSCARANENDEHDNYHHEQPQIDRSYLAGRRSILIATLLCFTVIGVLLIPFQWRLSHGANVLQSLSDTYHGRLADESFSILHPAEHIGRGPTTVKHQWRITKEYRRPDGVLKPVYCINGVFPGPTLEVIPGDHLIIEVHNGLDDEGLSFHWHGLSMRNANTMDGAVGITQASIQPGSNFTYDFTIDNDQRGTFWYHAHDQVQRAEGLYGGLIVHSAKENDDTADERLLLVSDWYHRSATEALHFYMHPGSFGNEPVPDSILLNGVGAFNCKDAVPARPLDCQQRVAAALPAVAMAGNKRTILRVVNVGSYAGMELSTSSAQLRPLRVDGGHKVLGHAARRVGLLHPGERVDLEITRTSLDHASRDMLHVTLDTSVFKYQNPALTPTHRFPVMWEDTTLMSSRLSRDNLELMDLSNLGPIETQFSLLPNVSDKTIVLYAITQKLAHLANEPHGFVNNTSWAPQAVPLISVDRRSWDKNQFVPRLPFKPQKPLWLDIVINNLDEEGHPFHLHGYDFWVVSTYTSTYNWGSFNPFEDEEAPGGDYDLTKAVKKDTVLVPRRGYAVLRLELDSPGIWMFHCHNLWHQASGMAMAFDIG